jgi:hypothetical protein
MHARIGTFDVDPSRLDEVVALFRGPVFEAFSRHGGFIGYQSYVDRPRMVGLSLWERLDDLEASAPTARHAREQAAALGATTVGEPQIVELAFDARASRPAPGQRDAGAIP